MLIDKGKAVIKDIGAKGVKSGLISVIGGLTCMAVNAVFTGVSSIFKKKAGIDDIDIGSVDIDEGETENDINEGSENPEETEVEV